MSSADEDEWNDERSGIRRAAAGAARRALGPSSAGRLGDAIGTKRALQLSIAGTMLAALLSLGFAPDRLFFVVAYPPGVKA